MRAQAAAIRVPVLVAVGTKDTIAGAPEALATLISVDICRARASATWSPTELPSRTLPRRVVLPLAYSRASSSVVLPER
jgi:hypothetical protein